MTLVLGIETSCDETAAAVVADGHRILSNVVASQIDLHRQYGGVFPEMASRQHVKAIIPVVEQAMGEARVTWDDLAAMAVTCGPGLTGSLLVGVNVAKGLAYGRGIPLIGVNHLEAHIATNWLDISAQNAWAVSPVASNGQRSLPGVADAEPAQEGQAAIQANGEIPFQVTFPLLCLVVSGGHTALILMSGYGEYQRLGGTIDDAAGEAFDKVARLLGLGYPGGPAIQRAAEQGSPTAFAFPRARLERSYDFSFSGLKTAVLRAVQKYEPDIRRPADAIPGASQKRAERGLHPRTVADLAASFQDSVVDVLVEKTARASVEHDVQGVLMAGGVAANRPLRRRMREALTVPLRMPPIALATDNATGVGVAGHWALQRGHTAGWNLDVVPGLKLA
jgi:N6-L-threonylcarbamoyladenine synthase